MSGATPGLVIFDCDGVLVNSERIVCDVESVELARYGIAMTPEQARATFKGRTLPENARTVEQLGGDRLPPTWLYDWAMAIAAAFAERLQPVAGVREVVRELAARGQAMCVATQSPPARARLSLRLTELAPYFERRVFTASQVARGKPAPDLFLFAAEQMGVDPAAALVIEDSASGVRAAVAAGMRVLGYAADEDSGALAAAGATVFTDMSELPRLLGLHEAGSPTDSSAG
ncbi:MAG: HAD family phosphatase [Polyangiaceae bacterium]